MSSLLTNDEAVVGRKGRPNLDNFSIHESNSLDRGYMLDPDDDFTGNSEYFREKELVFQLIEAVSKKEASRDDTYSSSLREVRFRSNHPHAPPFRRFEF